MANKTLLRVCVIGLCLVSYGRLFLPNSNASFRHLMAYYYVGENDIKDQSSKTNSVHQVQDDDGSDSGRKVKEEEEEEIPHHSTNKERSSSSDRPKIAIISSFVPGQQYTDTNRVKDLDHLINKACYAYIWGYDFIFNMTYGFEKGLLEDQGKYWLDYGTWNRVPHMKDRLADYDWILYADTDFVIQELTTPIESFFAEWKLYNRAPSLLLPRDVQHAAFPGMWPFSAFGLLVKNDKFGTAFLENWMDFAIGICPKGNLSPQRRDYIWEDSDQPGIWYSIVKTHMDFFPRYNFTNTLLKPLCNSTTGLINTDRAFGPELTQYCTKIGCKNGAFGNDLLKVPMDQPFLWSSPTVSTTSTPQQDEENRGKRDFGVQLKYGVEDSATINKVTQNAWAFHESRKHRWPGTKSHSMLNMCQQVHGCYAEYRDDDGLLHIGCNDIEYIVDQPKPPSSASSSKSQESLPQQQQEREESETETELTTASTVRRRLLHRPDPQPPL